MIRSVTDGLQTLVLLRRAHSSSHWPAERIRRTQAAALHRLLLHAYERVPLYRQLYDEAGFDPRAFRGLDDLEQVPVLTTERLKAAAPSEVVSRGVDPSRCQTVATSGSTGTPLRIHLGPAEVRWQRATA